MSDIPRTDEELVEMTTGHGPVVTKTTWVHSSLCFQLERELNAANDRIKRLEEAGDRMRLYCADADDCFAWDKAKEAKP